MKYETTKHVSIFVVIRGETSLVGLEALTSTTTKLGLAASRLDLDVSTF